MKSFTKLALALLLLVALVFAVSCDDPAPEKAGEEQYNIAGEILGAAISARGSFDPANPTNGIKVEGKTIFFENTNITYLEEGILNGSMSETETGMSCDLSLKKGDVTNTLKSETFKDTDKEITATLNGKKYIFETAKIFDK